MFRHIVILKVFLIILVINTKSQNFAPIGAEWHYEVEDIYGNLSYAKWVATNDTIILGKLSREIKLMNPPPPSDIQDSLIYLYEDSGVIYKYIEPLDTFSVLFDFNANQNDQWVMNVDTNCSLTVTVDSTSTTTINSNNLKILYLSTTNGEFSGKVIEHIGHHFSPIPTIDFLCNSITGGIDYYNGLRCYSDSTFGFYNSGLRFSCDTTFITGISKNIKTTEVKVFPNPTTGIINLESNKPIDEVVVYGFTGKIVLRPKFYNSSFNLKSLPKGYYLIRVLIDNKFIYKKISLI